MHVLVVLQEVLEHKIFLGVFIWVRFTFFFYFYVILLIFILAQLEVEKQYFATSLSVLEDQSIDMLIGLDMLRRHRVID
jgi:hypothetical protein